MFNFLFEGKIGDILAPVVPSNQLFLAIQHFKNNELNNLLNSTGYNPAALADGGYAAIHVACRYNNRVALDILLSRGTNIQLADQNGDTPLHYAAKYGHLDLCKFLVERGATVHARNRSNQSPYDLAESHLVRQYLLPIQLQAERGMPEFQQAQPYGNIGGIAYAPPPAGSISTNPSSIPPPAYAPPVSLQYGAPLQPQQHSTPLAQVPPNLAPPPAVPSVAGFSNSTPPLVHTPPLASPSVAPPVVPSSMPPSVPSYSYTATVSQNTRPSNTRMIQPDGFHSSASDPVLQQKYGHIIEKPSIAPPPTGPVSFVSSAPPPVAGPPIIGAPGVYSRYVPYDAHTNAAAPIPQTTSYNPHMYSSASMIAPGGSPQVGLVPPSQSQMKLPSSAEQSHVSQNPPTNRFLANKAPIAAGGDLFGGAVEPLLTTPSRPSPTGTQVLSPFNEGDVINAGSTSNSVL